MNRKPFFIFLLLLLASLLQAALCSADADPLFTVRELAWSVTEGGYLHYAFTAHYNDPEYVCEYPSVEIIVRDADGYLMGTHQQTLDIIYPDSDICWAGTAMDLTEKPGSVGIEFQINESSRRKPLRNYMTPEISGGKLQVGDTFTTFLAEIFNPNEVDMKAAVCIMVRDDEGRLSSGELFFLSAQLTAGKKTPCKELFSTDLKTVPDHYEFMIQNWGTYGLF